LLSLPSGILIARIMIPGTDETEGDQASMLQYRSSMDAVARGTADGLQLWLGIVAMLLVMVALVALADIILRNFPDAWGAPLTVERIFGWIFAPVVWLYGVPWDKAATAGALMGDKTIINEFVAYLKLASLPPDALDPRSRLIMLYAMCGFANFGSVGILIAGVGGMIPERRNDVVPLALRALLSGTMASGLTGAIIGLLPL
jgi:CNT family concentrative nucleoside transporter